MGALVELFSRVMTAPEIGVPDVSLSVPLIVKFVLTGVISGAATAESCVVPTVFTSTLTTLLVALP